MKSYRRKSKRWSPREDAILASGVESEMPYEEIGVQLGRTSGAVAQRVHHLRNHTPVLPPAKRVGPAEKAAPSPTAEVTEPDPAPKAPEMPDTMLDRVLEAERMVQQIPMLTLIAGAGAMMSFTTLVIVILALFA